MTQEKKNLMLLPPMEREEVEAALARLEPAVDEDNCLHGCPLCNAEAKLRAALDHPHAVEEKATKEERVVTDQGVIVFPAEAEECGPEVVREIATEHAEAGCKDVRVQIQESKTYRTEWVDVGEGDGG